MSRFSFIKFVALSALILIIVVLGIMYAKQPTRTGPQTKPDSLSQILANQSELKKFASVDELRDFFQSHRGATGNMGYATMESTRDSSVKQALPLSPSASPAAGLGGDLGGGGGGFSGTNIQVAGVDEADMVKTDGQYIYQIKELDLLITKATPAGEMAVVSTTDLKGSAQELYVKGNYLAVFGYSQMQVMPMTDIMPRYYSPTTFFVLFDISDRAQPKVLKRLEFEGSYVSSRLIDNQLYFITSYYNYYPLADDVLLPRVFENGAPISSDKTTDRYIYPSVYYIDTPSAINATTISILNLEDSGAPLNSQVFLMPAGETVYASTNAVYIAYTKYISEYQLRMAVTREVVAPRMNDRERQLLEAINNASSDILTDDEKLNKINQLLEGYLRRLSPEEQKNLNTEIENEFKRRHPDLANELEKTVIHKLGLSGRSLEYVGSGEVVGRLLNQYSLDEYNGHLRLATTRSQNWFQPFMMPMIDMPVSSTPEAPMAADVKIVPPTPPAETLSVNNVYVLDQSMKEVGSIIGLAQGERIYSARFMGNRAYIVTFRQTDPLFVIDLEDPAKPQVAGQLKLPGFSNYLHPYSDTVLLGIGKEAIDKGDQGVDVLGLKVSLFDVADPATPKEISSLVLGGRGSDSMALFDYKAVLFDKERNLLVIPASLTATNNTDYQANFQGSLVFNVTPNAITERGRINFRLPQDMMSNNMYLDDAVRRNLYIGDILYSVSPSTIKASQLNTLASVKSLSLPQRPPVTNPGPTPLPYVQDQTSPEPATR